MLLFRPTLIQQTVKITINVSRMSIIWQEIHNPLFLLITSAVDYKLATSTKTFKFLYSLWEPIIQVTCNGLQGPQWVLAIPISSNWRQFSFFIFFILFTDLPFLFSQAPVQSDVAADRICRKQTVLLVSALRLNAPVGGI